MSYKKVPSIETIKSRRKNTTFSLKNSMSPEAWKQFSEAVSKHYKTIK